MDLLSMGASGEQGGVAAFCFCATDGGPGAFGVGYVFDEEAFDYTTNAMAFTAKKAGTYTFYGFVTGGASGQRALTKNGETVLSGTQSAVISVATGDVFTYSYSWDVSGSLGYGVFITNA